MKKNNFILIFLTIFIFNVFASDGDLDTTFNPSGPLPGTNTNTFPPNTFNSASGIAIMNDGSLILAGVTSEFSADFAIAKYTSAGILDLSFGGGDGLVTTVFPGSTSQARDVQITSDSKIVAIGSTNSIQRFALAKYESNGNLDTSFGSGTGLVTTRITATSTNDLANAGVILSDGKIIAVGRSNVMSKSFLTLAKYNIDGTLDTSFSNSSSVDNPIPGTIRLDISGSSQASFGLGVVTQNVNGSEKILVVGTVSVNIGSYFLARFNLNGSFDTSFGINGIVIDKFDNSIAGSGSFVRGGVAIQDDKIVVAGGTFFGGISQGGFARYDINGQLDATFGTNGKVITSLITGVNAIQIMPNIQKIVAVGGKFQVMRLNKNGAVDSTFAENGIQQITFPGFTNGQVNDVIIQPDLKIVAGGTASNGMFDPSSFAIARLLEQKTPKKNCILLADQLTLAIREKYGLN